MRARATGTELATRVEMTEDEASMVLSEYDPHERDSAFVIFTGEIGFERDQELWARFRTDWEARRRSHDALASWIRVRE